MSGTASTVVRRRHAAPIAPRTSLGYVRGLDGLRAIAIAGVLAYHSGNDVMPGGFFGVEVFFVLSGYLVTTLLMVEARRRGRIDLRRFYLARARRLLPALITCVLATLILFQLASAAVSGLRTDALAALGYVQNWHLVFGHVPYSEAFDLPSPLLHLWSLAVEAQLYVVWPVVFVAVLAYLSRRRAAVLTLAAAGTSAVLMAVLVNPDDPSRVYYGTDARAAGFLVGATLALLAVPQLRGRVSRTATRLLDLAGGLALVTLLVAMAVVSEFDGGLYRGGFAKVELLSVVIIAAMVRPASNLGAVLGWAPLVWLGQRSYGVYLYHWPIFVLPSPKSKTGTSRCW